MKCDDRVAFSELGQCTCRLCHLHFYNVQHFLAHWNILNMERFVIIRPFAFTLVIHFTQQIRDLISHYTAASHVGVDEQGTLGGIQDVLKRSVQVDEPPVTLHGHLDEFFVDYMIPIFVSMSLLAVCIEGHRSGSARDFDG